MLTYVYGLRPWEVDRLTFREANRYLDMLDDLLGEGQV